MTVSNRSNDRQRQGLTVAGSVPRDRNLAAVYHGLPSQAARLLQWSISSMAKFSQSEGLARGGAAQLLFKAVHVSSRELVHADLPIAKLLRGMLGIAG
jgi:hypothetical protein